MKRGAILLIGFFALLICRDAYAENVLAINRMFDRTVYKFTSEGIDAEDIPLWIDKSVDPPLSAQAATEKAIVFMATINPREDMAWEQFSTTVHRLTDDTDYWYYKVEFHEELMKPIEYDGPIQTFIVVVFMNGEIPKPIISNK